MSLAILPLDNWHWSPYLLLWSAPNSGQVYLFSSLPFPVTSQLVFSPHLAKPCSPLLQSWSPSTSSIPWWINSLNLFNNLMQISIPSYPEKNCTLRGYGTRSGGTELVSGGPGKAANPIWVQGSGFGHMLSRRPAAGEWEPQGFALWTWNQNKGGGAVIRTLMAPGSKCLIQSSSQDVVSY